VSTRAPTTLDDLLAMDRHGLRAIVDRAHPLDRTVLEGRQYLGIDLSLPHFVNRLLWKTFRKTFVRDELTGGLRGWNVRMQQRGWDPGTSQEPMVRPDGQPWTFAHYAVADARGRRSPGGWQGADVLDYGGMGNPLGEALAYTPLVAVNAGDMDLLLGWEVFKLGPVFLPLPDFWALRVEGPVQHVVPAPQSTP